jgi:hypothetical protein
MDLWRLKVLVIAGALGFGVGNAYRQLRDLRRRCRVGRGAPDGD